MASSERLNRIKKARQGAVTATPDEPEKKPEIDLSDPETQDEILHPKAVSANIGGKEHILHPLSAKKAREFTGLVQQVIVETVSGKSEAKGAYPMLNRMAGIVAEKYGDDFLPFLAVATGEPGSMSASEATRLAAGFDEVVTYRELATAFVLVCDLNKTIQALSGEQSPNA